MRSNKKHIQTIKKDWTITQNGKKVPVPDQIEIKCLPIPQSFENVKDEPPSNAKVFEPEQVKSPKKFRKHFRWDYK